MSPDDISTHIEKTALIEEGAKIGKGAKVWHYAHIRKGAKVGDATIIGRNVQIDANVLVGSGCKIQNGVSVYSGVTIGDDVFVGPFAVFTNDLNPRAFNKSWKITPTLIHNGASIGANATIVCGNDIGEYAMVAAGAVVTKPVKPYQLVVGVPARHMGWVNKAGEIVSKDLERPTTLTD
jgi:acetyltransferase-like isoleucine patch superfamily enzyme